MFKNLISKIKGVLYKMNLIKGVKKATEVTETMVSDSFYDEVNKWKCVYQGYFSEFHDIHDFTIAKGRHLRKMSTLGMAKVICAEMATMVFNERCEISIDDGNNPFADNVKNVLSENAFYQNFQDYLEYMFALGGMVIKVYADGPTEALRIRLAYVSAECFVPIKDDGRRITEGAFINETKKGEYKYTLIEHHKFDNGTATITNKLYRTEKGGSDLGIEVPLSELYEDELEPQVEISNLKHPLFVYFRPNVANNLQIDSKLGISLFANSMGTLKTLDTIYDSFLRDFRLGKKRILVPGSFLRHGVDHDGVHRTYMDENDEVFQGVNMAEEKETITDINIQLRVQEHIDGINAQLEYLATQVGFSAGTFTFDAKGLKTATEVVSENSKTFKTRSSHITLIDEGLQDLVEIIADVASLYEVFEVPEEFEVKINFDDSITEDKQANANYWMGLYASGGCSQLQYIMKVQKVTEEEANEIIAQIRAERPTMLTDETIYPADGV